MGEGGGDDWMVSNHAVWGWKAPIEASVSPPRSNV